MIMRSLMGMLTVGLEPEIRKMMSIFASAVAVMAMK